MIYRRTHSFLTVGILLLGFTTIITQTVLLREFLTVFAGNELVIGIVLASWMILTGTGAYIGQFAKERFFGSNWILIVLTLISVLPVILLLILQFLRSVVFPIGSMVGISESIYSSLLLLAPFCLPSGFLFTLFCRAVSEEFRSNLISRVYSIEAIGSLVGGLLVSLVGIRFLSTFQILLVLCGLSLVVTFVLAWARWGRFAVMLYGSIVLFLVVILAVFGLEDAARRFMFRGQSVVERRDTPFGNLTVTKQEEQLNFYENGVLLFSTHDVIGNEEVVHYPMVQHPNPKRVLLVGGGISGTTLELLKYPVEAIDYLEVNPWLVDMGRRYTKSLDDPRINVIVEDARSFVRTTSSMYDVVIINTADPTTAQINRYYTVEFLEGLKARMNPGGVISLSVLPASEYLGPEARKVSSVIFSTVRAVFPNVLIIPGLRNYYLGSDSALSVNVGALITARGIENTYVNKFYVDDTVLAQRSATMHRNLFVGEGVNEDFRPLAYYRQLLYWLSYFRFQPTALGLFFLVVLIILAYRLTAISFGILVAGFAASSIEFLLLISFQVLLGYVYQFVGLLIAIFMAGLAAGAWYAYRRFGVATVRRFVVIQILIAIFALMLPWLMTWMRNANLGPWVVQPVILALAALTAALVGMQFAQATPLLSGSVIHVASELYGFDLVGSALGAFLTATYLLPQFGLANVAYMVAGLCLASAVIGLLRQKKLA